MEAHVDEGERHSRVSRSGQSSSWRLLVAFYPHQEKKLFDRLSLQCLSSLGILILVFKIDVKFGSVKFYDTRIVEQS